MTDPNERLTITLSPEASRRVRAHITSGEYSNASEFIERSVIAFDHEDSALEDWQLEEVLATCREIDEDPSQLRTPEQVRATLEAEFARALKAS